MYRINDDLVSFIPKLGILLTEMMSSILASLLIDLLLLKEYSVEIYEWSGAKWEPYVVDDVQVQFYMMSPYVLKTLSTDKKVLYGYLRKK